MRNLKAHGLTGVFIFLRLLCYTVYWWFFYDCEYCGFLQCELLQASELNADEYFFPQHLATVAPFILSFRKSSFPFHVHVNFAVTCSFESISLAKIVLTSRFTKKGEKTYLLKSNDQIMLKTYLKMFLLCSNLVAKNFMYIQNAQTEICKNLWTIPKKDFGWVLNPLVKTL